MSRPKDSEDLAKNLSHYMEALRNATIEECAKEIEILKIALVKKAAELERYREALQAWRGALATSEASAMGILEYATANQVVDEAFKRAESLTDKILDAKEVVP